MHQHITVAQRGEDALGRLALAERRRGGRHERRVLQGRTVHAVDLPQRRQVKQPGHLDDVARMDVELAQQQLEHVLGHVVGDFQPHRRAEPPPGQLALHRLQQVLVAILFDLHVGVAGDPERVMLDDLQAREQHRQEGGDQLLQGQEPDARRIALPAGELDEPVHVVGHLDSGEMLPAVVGLLHRDRQVQAQAADERERVGRVDGQWCQHREHLLVEVRRELVALGVIEFAHVTMTMPSSASAGRTESRKHLRVPERDLLGAFTDAAQLLAWRQAVGGTHRQPHLVAAFQARDPDHVKLVEIRREDGQETWHAPVAAAMYRPPARAPGR